MQYHCLPIFIVPTGLDGRLWLLGHCIYDVCVSSVSRVLQAPTIILLAARGNPVVREDPIMIVYST